MKAWSPRLLTKASLPPSGDQRRALADPRARISCSAGDESASDAHQTWPRWRNATRSLLGETAGELPSPSRHTAPPGTVTSQISCLTPVVRLRGLGISPRPLGPPPRV